MEENKSPHKNLQSIVKFRQLKPLDTSNLPGVYCERINSRIRNRFCRVENCPIKCPVNGGGHDIK